MGGGHLEFFWLHEVRGTDGPDDEIQSRGSSNLAGRGHRQCGTPNHGEGLTKASKTDQARQGCTVVVGSTGNKLCPVMAVLGFMAVANWRLGPLFQHASGKPLTQAGFVVEVKAALKWEGMQSEGFSGHCFRIGAATTAVEVGVGDAVIQLLGHWKSDAYKNYVQLEWGRPTGIQRQMVQWGADGKQEGRGSCQRNNDANGTS